MRFFLFFFSLLISVCTMAQSASVAMTTTPTESNEAYLRAKMIHDGLSEPMITKLLEARAELLKNAGNLNGSGFNKSTPVANSVCDMGVENGWNLWQWQKGDNSAGNPPVWAGSPASNPASPDFIATSGLGADPNTPGTPTGPKIPYVCPGFGSHSIRIGDTCGTGFVCQKLTFSLTVTPADTSFIYAYAAVLDNATGHLPKEQPFVSFGIYDQTSALIPGTGFMDTASAMTNYQPVSGSGCAILASGAVYKPWTIDTINLSAYIGQTVTIAIINADCAFGGHFAYSYFDFACGGLSMFTNVTTTPVTCPGLNGTASVSVSGGTPPFTYLWSNGQTTQTITGLAPGTYTLVVTDSTGFSSSNGGVVISNALSAVTTVNPVSCFGGSNGSVLMTVSNGTAPYTYQWSSGQTTKNINSLTVGVYSVTITDSQGCTYTHSVLVTGAPMLVSNSYVTPSSCWNCPDASAGTNAVGGTAPYNYTWYPGGQTTPIISGITAGSYTVCVKDSKNCSTCDVLFIFFQGVNELLDQSVSISPNPSSGNFVVDFGNKNFGSAEVSFTDLTGRTVLETRMKASGKQPLTINSVSTGVYFLKLKTEQGVTTKKVVISR